MPRTTPEQGLTYKDSGVDIAEAGKFVNTIQSLMRRTYGPRIIDIPNGFAGLCAMGTGGHAHPQLRPARPGGVHRRRGHQAQDRLHDGQA